MNEELMKTAEHVETNEELVSSADQVESGEEEKITWNEHETPGENVESWTGPLLRDEEIDDLQSRWNALQVNFIDEPRTSVEQADALVSDTMEKIARAFSEKRKTLNQMWVDHENVSTEDFRLTLQRYRSFFNRLLML